MVSLCLAVLFIDSPTQDDLPVADFEGDSLMKQDFFEGLKDQFSYSQAILTFSINALADTDDDSLDDEVESKGPNFETV